MKCCNYEYFSKNYLESDLSSTVRNDDNLFIFNKIIHCKHLKEVDKVILLEQYCQNNLTLKTVIDKLYLE